MKSTGSSTPDRLTSDEIGAALDRIVASDPFRTSPQLVAFLRFVVAATLAGHGDRLKGYTIAVEALGRSEDFDPQSDPIVRVEAARLRRALERYYAEAGSGEPIIVELPRGSYIPVFHYRGIRPGQPVLTLSRGARPPERARALPLVVAAIAVLGVGIGLVWALGMPRIPHGPVTMAIFKPMSERSPAAALQPGSGLPVVAIQPFDAVGTPSEPAFALGDLKRKLSDALARFDEIQVASAASARVGVSPEPPGARSDYWLAATAEYRRDGAVDLTFRLHDASDGTVAWTRTFANVDRTDAAAAREDIVRQVVTTVAPPYGVIYARERALGASKARDPRYRCLLEAFDYRRSFDFSQRDRVRACLENVTARDPTFAGGFAALAMLSIHDYYYGGGGEVALQDGLKAAKRAIEADPESARAHHAMMNVLFARGQIAAALAEGEKAVALNSYDMIVLASYGMRLVGGGEIDKGEAALRQAASFGPVRPAMLDFSLFLTAYLNGDDTSAAYHASLLTSEIYPFGLIARALVAAKAGERDEARRIIDRLVALHAEWRDDPRAAIERYIRAPAIVERLARDLAEAGLAGAASDPAKAASFTAATGAPGSTLEPGWGMPLVSVQPFITIGTPAAPTPALDDLHRKLRDALARFDEIEVVSEPFTTASRTALPKGSTARGAYRLGATLQHHPEGTISMAFRLSDEVDGTLAWARSFDNIRIGGDADAAANDIVRRLAATLAQPYGVIYARELAKRRGDDADPRYRCVLDTMEFRRIDDRTRHDHVRACLERTTALDPTFANGFALLAVLTLREYYELDDGGAEKLDRALAAAQLAVALKPQSARARQALMNALFARGKVAPALAEGDKAVALNPNDMTVLIGFGMRLVAGGEVDKAAEVLQTAAAFTPVHTPILDFGLFVCDYLRGDDAGAAYRASLLTSETYPPALLARALVAAKAGDRARARETIAKLVALYPAWNGSLQGKLGRFIPEKTIVDRIARDLAAAGLGAEN